MKKLASVLKDLATMLDNEMFSPELLQKIVLLIRALTWYPVGEHDVDAIKDHINRIEEMMPRPLIFAGKYAVKDLL